jgi:hypothetical protein
LPIRQPEPFDADEVYRQLGIFVVSFQHVESKLAEICWLLTEPPYADGERQVLAQLPYGRLVQETRDRIAAFLERRRLDRPQFVERSQARRRDRVTTSLATRPGAVSDE